MLFSCIGDELHFWEVVGGVGVFVLWVGVVFAEREFQLLYAFEEVVGAAGCCGVY